MKKAMLRKLRAIPERDTKEEPIKIEKDNNVNKIKIKAVKKVKNYKKKSDK